MVAVSDEEVVVLWHQKGTRSNGERLDSRVLGLYHVRDGKLAGAQMFYFDSRGVVRCLDEAARDAGEA